MIGESGARSPYQKYTNNPYGLTWREREVLAAVITGKPHEELSVSLGIELKTFKFHLTNIYSKYNVRTLPQLIVKCHNDEIRKGVLK